MEKKKIIVLGGGADQIGLIQDLKERGYYTILVDYYPNPVAKPYADRHIQESTLDNEKVLQIAVQEKVQNVITACIDQPLVTVAYVAEKLGFPTQFSYKKALLVTNKQQMKMRMWESGIPTSRFKIINDANEDIRDLRFPLMIKPADCNGSLGVRKANNHEEYVEFFNKASMCSRTHSVIVEEFVEGKEVGIDCYIKDGKAQLLMMGEVRKRKIGTNVLLIYQTYIPADIQEGAKKNIQRIADQIASAFELDNTPLLIQTMVNGDDVSVIEFAPRIGGASKYRTIQAKTGFNILHANVGAVFGEVPEIKTIPDDNYFSRNHVYTYPCVFSHVEGADALIEKGIIEEYIPYKSSGMEIGTNYASRDRIGSFLVKAPTFEEMKQKIRVAVRELKAFDTLGKEVLNREIWDFDN